MKALIDESLKRIESWNQQWPKAAVLWSGGKDSTVMLHLLKFGAGLDLPVIQYREPKFRERYAYSDRMIKEWGLEIYDYPPSLVQLGSGPDTETGEMRFDLIKHYQWGKKHISLCLGTERPKSGEKYLCAVNDYLARPTGTIDFKWPAIYIGTKNTDTDLIKGNVCVKQHTRIVEGCPVSLYPIRDWTDKDIFTYLEDNAIEADPTRYIKVDGQWKNNPDKSLNSDFYPVCLNCVDRHQGPTVYCPKFNGTITNISGSAPYTDVVNEDLGFRPIWKDNQGKELANAAS